MHGGDYLPPQLPQCAGQAQNAAQRVPVRIFMRQDHDGPGVIKQGPGDSVKVSIGDGGVSHACNYRG
ncbi:hypothetical protein GCM10010844_04080 [Deinococcus radiotolerans]|uniref:Uncharacterized protein n=1 Tax=Deinococcus radiotolerans TaxID=1309407 RepID=A0ABQ2FGM4_9DEIO|nr:hypothetical protein GCM10010844_04080 [Deinococcus radiotolerans]